MVTLSIFHFIAMDMCIITIINSINTINIIDLLTNNNNKLILINRSMINIYLDI